MREGEELWSLALADVRVVIEYVSPSLGIGVDHCFALVDGEMNEYHLLVDDFLCEQVIPALQSVLGCDLSCDFYDGALEFQSQILYPAELRGVAGYCLKKVDGSLLKRSVNSLLGRAEMHLSEEARGLCQGE